jgi:hypothetical protein
MDPFDTDRPTLDRPSLDRIERMRSRPAPTKPPSRPVFPWILAAVLLAFALGLIANPWFERSVRSNLPGFAATTLPTVADLDSAREKVTALEARVKALEARPHVVASGGTIGGERMMRAETRLDGVDRTLTAEAKRVDSLGAEIASVGARVDATASATQATLVTAARGAEAAQAVLVLGTTRRMLENGERLGTVEPVLQRSFGGGYPQPVAAVVALGNAPATPRSLRADLLRLRPALTGVTAPHATSASSWWDSLSESLSSIARIRENGSKAAPTDPAARIDLAVAALTVGNVSAAAAQVAALPPQRKAQAGAWLAAAARYQAGMRGLATLEAAALAPPPMPAENGLPVK